MNSEISNFNTITFVISIIRYVILLGVPVLNRSVKTSVSHSFPKVDQIHVKYHTETFKISCGSDHKVYIWSKTGLL